MHAYTHNVNLIKVFRNYNINQGSQNLYVCSANLGVQIDSFHCTRDCGRDELLYPNVSNERHHHTFVINIYLTVSPSYTVTHP